MLSFQQRKWAIKFSLAREVAKMIMTWNKNPTDSQRKAWFSRICAHGGNIEWCVSACRPSSRWGDRTAQHQQLRLSLLARLAAQQTAHSSISPPGAPDCGFQTDYNGCWITINRITTVSYQFTAPKKITIVWESQMTLGMVLTNDTVIYCNLQVYYLIPLMCFQITPELCCLHF